jgi:hypothetical protein
MCCMEASSGLKGTVAIHPIYGDLQGLRAILVASNTIDGSSRLLPLPTSHHSSVNCLQLFSPFSSIDEILPTWLIAYRLQDGQIVRRDSPIINMRSIKSDHTIGLLQPSVLLSVRRTYQDSGSSSRCLHIASFIYKLHVMVLHSCECNMPWRKAKSTFTHRKMREEIPRFRHFRTVQAEISEIWLISCVWVLLPSVYLMSPRAGPSSSPCICNSWIFAHGAQFNAFLPHCPNIASSGTFVDSGKITQ